MPNSLKQMTLMTLLGNSHDGNPLKKRVSRGYKYGILSGPRTYLRSRRERYGSGAPPAPPNCSCSCGSKPYAHTLLHPPTRPSCQATSLQGPPLLTNRARDLCPPLPHPIISNTVTPLLLGTTLGPSGSWGIEVELSLFANKAT